MPITAQPSMRLLEALAEEHDQEIDDLSVQLYDWFDPEAFDSLVDSAEGITISVEVDGQKVVYRDGEITVHPKKLRTPMA